MNSCNRGLAHVYGIVLMCSKYDILSLIYFIFFPCIALSDFPTSAVRWRNILPAAMTEFWLISAPGEKTCQQTWDKLMVATTRTNNLSTNNKFNIPDLKVMNNAPLQLL